MLFSLTQRNNVCHLKKGDFYSYGCMHVTKSKTGSHGAFQDDPSRHLKECEKSSLTSSSESCEGYANKTHLIWCLIVEIIYLILFLYLKRLMRVISVYLFPRDPHESRWSAHLTLVKLTRESLMYITCIFSHSSSLSFTHTYI